MMDGKTLNYKLLMGYAQAIKEDIENADDMSDFAYGYARGAKDAMLFTLRHVDAALAETVKALIKGDVGAQN